MQILYFTLVGIGCYLAADWLLRRVERAHGGDLPHRPLVFFGILLSLVLVSFAIVRRLTG